MNDGTIPIIRGRLVNLTLAYNKAVAIFRYLLTYGPGRLFTKLRVENEFKVGKVVGKDQFGNTYYENKDLMYSRDRWVEWPKRGPWTFQTRDQMEATEIPPEWHLWLSRFSEKTPAEQNYPEPIYREPHRPNPTGGPNAYLPPGHFMNPKNNTPLALHLMKRYDSWQPNLAQGKTQEKLL